MSLRGTETIPLKTDSLRAKKGIWKLKDTSGLVAGGINRARFKVRKKDQRVMFRARGKKMEFREGTNRGGKYSIVRVFGLLISSL